MGAILNLPQTFEQRIATFSAQIEVETDGEYSVVPQYDGYVCLMYKGVELIAILAHGKTYKRLYQDISVLVRAFLAHQIADAINSFED